jgi:hypothetical protein
LSLGTLAAPVEGVIYAAKVAGGVAHVANLGALGYMGYEGGTALLEYYKFLQTPSGTRLFEAAKKEFFGGGLSKNEAIALASDMFKAGEFKAEREKDKLLAENTPSSLIPAGLSGRQPLNGKPGMTPDVVAGLENAPTPGKNKLALDPPPVG